MTRKNDQIDLCMNCLNIDHCFYYRTKTEPVIFCEEFTCEEPKVSSIQNHGLEDAETRPLIKKTRPVY